MPAGELVLCATQGLQGMGLILLLGANTEQSLSNLNPCDGAEGLSEGAAHAGLEAIGARAREHLVDADDVERVGAHAQVEGVLAARLGHVLVARDARGLERLRRELLLLVRDEVGGERELVHAGALAAQVEDADLRVRHAAAVARLGVRLVLAVAVATRGACARGGDANGGRGGEREQWRGGALARGLRRRRRAKRRARVGRSR